MSYNRKYSRVIIYYVGSLIRFYKGTFINNKIRFGLGTVKNVGYHVFLGCNKLESIEFEYGVESIDVSEWVDLPCLAKVLSPATASLRHLPPFRKNDPKYGIINPKRLLLFAICFSNTFCLIGRSIFPSTERADKLAPYIFFVFIHRYIYKVTCIILVCRQLIW